MNTITADRNASNWVRSLADMSDSHLNRLQWRVYGRMSAGDHFGCDWVTARIVCPQLAALYRFILDEIDYRESPMSIARAAGFVS